MYVVPLMLRLYVAINILLHLLMMLHEWCGYRFWKLKTKFFNTSRNFMTRWKEWKENLWSVFVVIMEVNTHLMNSKVTAPRKALDMKRQFLVPHSKMVWQKGWIALLLRRLDVCWGVPDLTPTSSSSDNATNREEVQDENYDDEPTEFDVDEPAGDDVTYIDGVEQGE